MSLPAEMSDDMGAPIVSEAPYKRIRGSEDASAVGKRVGALDGSHLSGGIGIMVERG